MKKTFTIKKRYTRIAPPKVRIVGQALKGLSVEKAQRRLQLVEKRSARILESMLKQATTILESKNLNKQHFNILSVRCDQGPALKRYIPRSRGRTSPLKKYSSHIMIELARIKKSSFSKNKK